MSGGDYGFFTPEQIEERRAAVIRELSKRERRAANA